MTPEIEAMGGHFRHACGMTVRTADGRAFAHEILHRHGSPEAAVGWPEVTEKFRSITRDLLSPAEQDRMCGLVRDLGRAASPAETLDALCAIVAPNGGPMLRLSPAPHARLEGGEAAEAPERSS